MVSQRHAPINRLLVNNVQTSERSARTMVRMSRGKHIGDRRGEVESFEALFGEADATSMAVEGFDEFFTPGARFGRQEPLATEDQGLVEHASTPTVLVAGKVGPKLDGTKDTAQVAIVSPAAHKDKADIDKQRKKVTARFKARGHEVSLVHAPGAPFKSRLVKKEYALAGTDDERWEATRWGLFDPSTSAMICVRGGYGVTRMKGPASVWWPIFNSGKLPKRVVGYSDVTALLLALYSKLGWASIHGPMLGDADKGDETLDSLVDVLTKDPKNLYTNHMVADGLDVVGDAASASMTVTGVLLGGNLSLVEALYGTTYLPSLQGAILFLEETEEREYKIDRMLQALSLRSGSQVAAIVLGTFSKASAKETAELAAEKWSVPIVHGLKSGHSTPNRALWIGLEYRLELDKGKAKLFLVPPP